MKISTWLAIVAACVCSTFAAAQSIERPWQHSDGTIVFKKKTYPSWNAFHASPDFDALGKCAAPNPDLVGPGGPDAEALRGIDPSDCTYTSTTIDPIYNAEIETYQIRCVVHVIRNTAGTLGDISPEMVASGIRILNEDFNAISGTPGQPGTFANIEFRIVSLRTADTTDT